MDFGGRNCLEMRETDMHLNKGQTMTEYALILAAVAIAVFIAYKTMGNSITSMVQAISNQLTGAS
jgi:Flp pilus assembly pilin Flp